MADPSSTLPPGTGVGPVVGSLSRRILRTLGLLVGLALGAQSPPDQSFQGHPLVTNYGPETYAAHSQNWAAVQDARGVLYVANTLGVLEFSGQEWRLIRIGEGIAARSLALDAQGRVHVGAFGDFGVLRPDPQGRLAYVSLAASHGVPAGQVGDVVTAVAGPSGVYFQSSQGVYHLRDGRLQVHRPQKDFRLGFLVRDQFYVRSPGRGLLHLQDGRMALVEGSERFGEDRIFCMLPRKDGTILVGARTGGFLAFNPSEAPANRFRKLPGFKDIESRSGDLKVSTCDLLPDGRIAIGTVQQGLYLCDPEGPILLHLDKTTGLGDNCVYYVYTDRWGNLVLCLNVGLGLVETTSPFTFMNERIGVSGTGTLAYLHKDRQGRRRCFIGTSQGLFYRDEGQPRFQNVPGSQESWGLVEAQGQLLLASNDGVHRLEGTRRVPILTGPISLGFKAPQGRTDLLLVPAMDGIHRLAYQGGRWVPQGAVEGFKHSAFNFCQALDGSFWLQTMTGDGIHRLRLSEDCRRVVEHRTFTKRDGLPSDSGNSPFLSRTGILVGTSRGIYRLRADGQGMEPDARFPAPPEEERAVRVILEDRKGHILVFGEGFSDYYAPLPQGGYAPVVGPYRRLAHFRGGESAMELEDGSLMVAYQDGFVRVDASAGFSSLPEFQSLVRRVETPMGVFFPGTVPRIPYEGNSMRFIHAAPFFQGAPQTEFSFLLEGFDRTWSSYRRQAQSVYTNLPQGRYLFRVKARNVFGQVSPEATYAFTLLAPWWGTWWFRSLVVLAGLGIIALVFRWRMAVLHQRNAELERLVAERTLDLQAAKEVAEEARGQAERASAFKSLFLSTTSHEIRTPLNAILGFLQLLTGSEVRESDRRQFLHIMKGAAESLLQLVNDLLDLGRIEAGMLELEPAPFDPRVVLEEALTLLASRAREHHLLLVGEVALDVPARLRGDPHRIRQMLVNLLGNAVKFTPRGHVIVRISVQGILENGLLLEVAVQDTGEGVPAHVLPRLFQPYTQAESRAKAQGTGLGLSITLHLAQCMGGEVGATSEVGQGSRFWFTFQAEVLEPPPGDRPLKDLRVGIRTALPALDATLAHHALRFGAQRVEAEAEIWITDDPQGVPEGAKVLRTLDTFAQDPGTGALLRLPFGEDAFLRAFRTGESAVPRVPGPGMREAGPMEGRVLFADDNSANRMVMKAILEQWQIPYLLVGDGLEALEAFGKAPFEIVILDGNMPGLNGLETLRQLRDLPGGREAVVLLHSASLETSFLDHALEKGFDDVLLKPIQMDDFREHVAQRLRRGPAKAAEPVDPGLDLDRLVRMGELMGGAEGLREFIEVFIVDGRERLPNLRNALKAQDRMAFQTLAHDLKTNAGNLGIHKLRTLAEAMEREAMEADWKDQEARLEEARSLFQHAAAQLEAWSPGP